MSQILIYNDCGVSPSCFQQAESNVKKIIDTSVLSVQPIDSKMLINEEWEEGAVLLIFPGGRDLPYHQKLSFKGTSKIRNFVASGGRYLGFCAGGYFGAKEILFEERGELEVKGARDLEFFPGKAVGPAYGNGIFRYDSDAGAREAPIEWQKGDVSHSFFNGGCFFEEVSSSNVQILGRYSDLPGKPAAVVFCSVGKGAAILSGVHVEFSADRFLEALLLQLDIKIRDKLN